MRRGKLVLACVLVALAMAIVSIPARAITFGTTDAVHTYAGAWIGERPDGSFRWCSGTLLAPRIFLSAAHCVFLFFNAFGIGVDKMWVSFDTKIPQAVQPSWHPVASFMVDPLFSSSPYVQSNPNDLVVVILKDAVTGVIPGRLAPVGYLNGLDAAGTLRGAVFTLVGYGRDENRSIGCGTANACYELTSERRMTEGGFQALTDAWLFVSANTNQGFGGICAGDSGGPTLLASGGTEYVVGIHVGGDANCDSTSGYSLNYRVDTAGAQAFILSEMASTT